MIDDDTRFLLQKMHYTGIDHDFVRSLGNALLESGIWIDDFDLLIGFESKESANIEKVFHRICERYAIPEVSPEEFKEHTKVYYSKKIILASGDHQKVMNAVYNMVSVIQDDLGFRAKDKKCAGEAAGIEDFIGPYYEYEEYDFYELTEAQKQEARDRDILQATEAANKSIESTEPLGPSFD